MLGDLDSLPDEDKIRMSTMIDQLQIRDRFFFNFLSLSLTHPPTSVHRFLWALNIYAKIET